MKIKQLDLLKELQNHAEKFLMENFELDLNIPITINNRLRSTGGRFRFEYNTFFKVSKSVDIQIAKFVCENGTIEEILDILEHECIHYALFEMGKPYNDNDNYFINTCNRLNVRLGHHVVNKLNTYSCPDCETLIERSRKIPKNYYMICKHCKGKISGEHLVNVKSMKIRQII